MLQKVCELWSTGPKFLTEAAKQTDVMERMKKVIGFFISGLHMAVT